MSAARPVRILVVDDDDGNRYFKAHVLRGAGYCVEEAARGADGLRQVASAPPDLVLLDVRLPDMSGLDVCRKIKAGNPGVIVLQTSAAFTGTRDRAAGLEGGADSYLVEPLDAAELTAAVRALLRLREAEQELRSLNETLEQRVAERTRELADAHRRLADEAAERAKAEEALRHAERLDALGQLTGGVAHDFNNLLTVVIGNLDLIEQSLAAAAAPAPRQVAALLGNAQRAALDCERLTSRLLAFARRDTLRLEVVDLTSVISRFVSMLRHALGERMTVELALQPGLWHCRVDPRQFEAALLNLAVNARDAMPLGGPIRIGTGNFELTAGTAPAPGMAPGAYVHVWVADTGTGMTEEVRARAFEPFFTTKDVGRGSGLGLSQVYGFVRQSGGHVVLDSALGRGSQVHLYLPRADEAPDRTRATEEHRASCALPGGSETILVVEDNEIVLDFAAAILAELGYRVLHATDGRSALEVIRREAAIDLMFTDVVMPNRMNGVELARAAQQLRPGLKVLMTSGYSARNTGAASVAGEFPTIAKPYRAADLAARIRAALDP